MLVKDSQFFTFIRALAVMGYLSQVLSALPVLFMITLYLYDRKLVNRITLRLQAGVSLIDFLNHLNAKLYDKVPAGATCNFLGFFRFYGRHVYCFLNIAIALNLQLVFLQNLTFNPKWEYYYWGVSLVLGLILSVPPYAMGIFGLDNFGYCLVEKSYPHSAILIFLLIVVVFIITCIYCAIISILVIFKLNNNIQIIKDHAHQKASSVVGNRTKLENFLKKLIFRVSLYPLICMILVSGFVVRSVVNLADIDENWLFYWDASGSALTGTFNFIAFVLDPTFHIALLEMYTAFRTKYFNNRSKHQLQDDVELASISNSSTTNLSSSNHGTNSHLLDNTKQY